MATSTVRMKLLINTEDGSVLYAEASKDFVDLLFYLLSLPISTAVRLIKEQLGMAGSLGSLYESIENLHDSYLQPNIGKDVLLNPARIGGGFVPSVRLLPGKDDAPLERKLYGCSSCPARVTYDFGITCQRCYTQMSRAVEYVGSKPPPTPRSECGGFVNGVVTYMVMDDLVVKPITSIISGINLLKDKFRINDVRNVKEIEVYLGKEEAIALLKASFMSNKVLTDVFLKDAKYQVPRRPRASLALKYAAVGTSIEAPDCERNDWQ